MAEKVIRQDILNFKEYIETKHNPGGVATTAGAAPSMHAQPQGEGMEPGGGGQYASH
jgi:hypothetical protein